MTWISWTTFGALFVGFGSGILSALAGVGGAVVSTPGIRALGATPIQAVGSTVPAIIPSAITGTIRYAKAGLVDWQVGLICGIAGAVSAVIGAEASGHLGGETLMVATAFLVLWSAASMLRGAFAGRTGATAPAPALVGAGGAATGTEAPIAPLADAEAIPVAGPERHNPVLLAAVGIGAGFVAGLLGVGGGLILVPAFSGLLRLPVKKTVATSLLAVALMSTSSLIAHAAAGHIDWAFALPLAIGVVPGARIGSRFTVSASEQTMKLLCGGLLSILGAVYLITELTR